MNQDGPAAPERARQGAPWLPEEDRQLYDAFVSGRSAKEAAISHQRSDGAIRSRLRRLGLVDDNGETIEPLPPFRAPVSARVQTRTPPSSRSLLSRPPKGGESKSSRTCPLPAT